MFYSHFVLQKKGPLARIWLAAHWDKKLTKAQVFETNIEASVDGILKPKVKIALRTSGHLLLGVVRIYSRKAKYLLADCNEAFVKIKMAFRPGLVDLPEENKDAHTIALQDVFQNFDETMPDLNDVDIEAQFSLNQSRAEEITMREEYNLCMPAEEGFGDMGFDNEPPDMLRNTVDQSHLLFNEPEHLSLPDKEPQPSTSRAATRSLEIDTPIRGDGFGGNLGPDIITGGLFEGGLSLFDDPPIVGEMPGVPDMGSKDVQQDQRVPPPPDSDDDGDHDFGGPPSVGGHSSDGSRGPTPLPVQHEPNLSHLADAASMQLGPDHIQMEAHLDIPQPDQTTLIQNEEESFALAPVDASAIRGIQKAKRKRKLIVDEVKNISGEEMKAQLSDTSDIVISLDLAPPTKRLMLWKESGGVEKLFALPSRQISSRTLFKSFQRMLTLRAVDNDAYEMDRQDDIPLEQMRDADADNAENIPPTSAKRGRKRKQPEIEESIQQKDGVGEMSSIAIPAQADMLAPATPASVTPHPSITDNFPIMPPAANVSDLVPPMSVGPELPLSLFPPSQTPLHQIEDIPAEQLHSLLENTQMENMGYDHNNPYANLGYDDQQHAPATTPGAMSEKGAPTPWNEDYDFPQSAGPTEEQQTDETYEQFEERVVNKRAAHMYQILKSRFARQDAIQFTEMAHRNNKKQVSQKFYTLLVLKKTQVVELEQEEAFSDILITKGASYETPVL